LKIIVGIVRSELLGSVVKLVLFRTQHLRRQLIEAVVIAPFVT